ncbi:hypothetical protein RhiirB3_391999 [Rhizophagus irregularis]|nr:hypothetical protein RhiirB3_391999 [Rhizophagus irregularis]
MSITLLCLVKGNTLANAFPIDVEKDQLVGRLKKVIKAAKQNKFTSVDADKFRLRKVEISVDRERSVEQSLLRDKDELLAKRDIGYWTENRLRGIFVKLPHMASLPLTTITGFYVESIQSSGFQKLFHHICLYNSASKRESKSPHPQVLVLLVPVHEDNNSRTLRSLKIVF